MWMYDKKNYVSVFLFGTVQLTELRMHLEHSWDKLFQICKILINIYKTAKSVEFKLYEQDLLRLWTVLELMSLMAAVSRDCSVRWGSYWWLGSRGFESCQVQQHSVVEIIKCFLQSFSPFSRFKKGSCQLLAKECTQVLVNCLED